MTSLQSRLSALESTNTDLTAQLLSTQSQLSITQTQLAKHDEEGAKRDERERGELQTEMATLKQKLMTYLDYDEIKRELEIMKVSQPAETKWTHLKRNLHAHPIVCRVWRSRRRFL